LICYGFYVDFFPAITLLVPGYSGFSPKKVKKRFKKNEKAAKFFRYVHNSTKISIEKVEKSLFVKKNFHRRSDSNPRLLARDAALPISDELCTYLKNLAAFSAFLPFF